MKLPARRFVICTSDGKYLWGQTNWHGLWFTLDKWIDKDKFDSYQTCNFYTLGFCQLELLLLKSRRDEFGKRDRKYIDKFIIAEIKIVPFEA